MPIPEAQEPARMPHPSDGGPRVPARPALVMAAAGLFFLLITWQVVAHGPLARVDERIDGAVVRPDRISGLLADLGNIAVAVPVLAVALGYATLRARRAGTHRWWLPAVAAAGLMAVLPALIVPLKEAIARPGPPVMGPATGFYPSGHTATAALAYGAAALVLWPWLTTQYARRGLLAVCAALQLGVAFGLVRHGYHWPLDVVGSWSLCAVLLCALRLLLGLLPGAGRRFLITGPGRLRRRSGR
ncbi:phosphatase PAP2 family protein [Streptomyces sp. NPDC046931]|uniref:phosphatase PAP2 family protein n=1 Tax=Streptomyces sp. NPDC046931 TaxID=3154806 RepID=UPI0033C177B5